jgi:hypothetical protein
VDNLPQRASSVAAVATVSASESNGCLKSYESHLGSTRSLTVPDSKGVFSREQVVLRTSNERARHFQQADAVVHVRSFRLPPDLCPIEPRNDHRLRKRYRAATTLAESAPNSLVGKRTVKKQQMRWLLHGAHIFMESARRRQMANFATGCGHRSDSLNRAYAIIQTKTAPAARRMPQKNYRSRSKDSAIGRSRPARLHGLSGSPSGFEKG